jgi:hypothetical protein
LAPFPVLRSAGGEKIHDLARFEMKAASDQNKTVRKALLSEVSHNGEMGNVGPGRHLSKITVAKMMLIDRFDEHLKEDRRGPRVITAMFAAISPILVRLKTLRFQMHHGKRTHHMEE